MSQQRPQLAYGYSRGLPDDVTTAWGCRAVLTAANSVDIVWDRTSEVGHPGDLNRLVECLDSVAQTWLDKASELLTLGRMSPRDSREHVLFDDGFLVVKANTNASSGYLYVCAYLTP